MIEIRHLRHIMALAEYQSFKKAAKSIGISQPALTISIRIAEDWFGAKLFERRPRMVVPTPYGSIVIEGARKILVKVDEVKRDVDLMHGLQKGTIRIAADPYLAEGLLGPVIGSLIENYPKLKFDIIDGNWNSLIDMLKEGQVEMILAAYSKETDLQVEEKEVNFIQIKGPAPVYFVRAGHPLANKKKVDVEDIKKYPFAASRSRPAYYKWLSHATGVSVDDLQNKHVSFICDNFSITKTIIKHSNTISAAAYETLAGDLKEGTIKEIKVNWLIPHAQVIGLIGYLNDRVLSPAAELLIEKLKAASD